MQVVGQVEIDEYCTKILAHHWPDVPRWKDIKEVTAEDIITRCGAIDLICGGFPCQDISTAGKGAGLAGARSGLWWEMWRLIRDIRPDWVLIENVPALRTRGADDVLKALEALDYTCRSLVVGAWAVGAQHERERVWIVCVRSDFDSARRLHERGSGLLDRKWQERGDNTDGCSSAGLQAATIRSDSDSAGREGLRRTRAARFAKSPYGPEQWDWEEPRTVRADATKSKVGLRAVGNSVVPRVVEAIGRAIMRIDQLV